MSSAFSRSFTDRDPVFRESLNHLPVAISGVVRGENTENRVPKGPAIDRAVLCGRMEA